MSLDAVGIVSHDLSKTVEFYALFGVALKEAGGPDHFEAKLQSGVRLMADSVTLIKKLHPNWEKPTGNGIVLCFKKESAKEVDALHAAVVEAGFSSIKSPWDAFWGQRYSSVLDPDGNQIDIFADL